MMCGEQAGGLSWTCGMPTEARNRVQLIGSALRKCARLKQKSSCFVLRILYWNFKEVLRISIEIVIAFSNGLQVGEISQINICVLQGGISSGNFSENPSSRFNPTPEASDVEPPSITTGESPVATSTGDEEPRRPGRGPAR
jgi:hypothetical protein